VDADSDARWRRSRRRRRRRRRRRWGRRRQRWRRRSFNVGRVLVSVTPCLSRSYNGEGWVSS
jgi:hypothetical protein